jgi:short-subunit dehydrogenase
MARRSVAGLRILITGASQGIGRALAVAAARKGAKVLAAARSEGLLAEVVQEASAKAGAANSGGVVQPVAADVTSAGDRQRLVEAAQRHFGGLDVLINNAGIGATGHFVDASPDRLRKIMEVNFFGTTETTRVCLPLLKQGKTPAIVNISSIAGRRGIPARSDYSASKFAVQGFSEALRAELAKDGIDVILVNPGLTQTNFSKNMLEQKALVKMDHLRGMTSEEVAEHTLRALEKGTSEKTLTLSGKLIVLVNRFFPWLADLITRRKVRSLFRDEIAAREALRRQLAQEHRDTTPVG